jgi:hypothetical protein
MTMRATHPQLALAADVLVVAAEGVDDAALGVGDGDPDRAGLVLPRRGDVAGRAHLGHAVGLHDRAADTGRGLLGELGAQRRGARQDQLERRQVVVVDDRLLGQRQDHRRHRVEVREAVVLDEAEGADEVEPGHGDHRAAVGEQAVHQDLHAVDVEERQDGQPAVALLVGEDAVALGQVGDHVAMREHHALREPGGARRVRQHHRLGGGVDGHLLDGVAQALGHAGGAGGRLLVGPADGEDPIDGGALDGLERDGREHRQCHQHRRACVEQLEADLFGRVAGVDGRDDATGHAGAVEDHGVLGHVGRHQRQRVSGCEAGCSQPAGEPRDAVGELAEGDDPTGRPLDERGLVGEALGVAQHVRGDRDVGDLDIGQWAGVDDRHGSVPLARSDAVVRDRS